MKAIDILKEALKVFGKNPNFILFTALISLPLFFFSHHFQNLVHGFVFEASKSLPPKAETFQEPELSLYEIPFESNVNEASQSLPPKAETFQEPELSLHEIPLESNVTSINNGTFIPREKYLIVKTVQLSYISPNFDWSVPIGLVRNLSKDQLQKLLHLGFLYLAPFNLLQLVTAILIVDLSSKLHREGKALTFKDMLGTRFSGERLRGVFATFLYVVVFSVSTLTGFVWLALTYSAVLDYLPRGNRSDFYYYSSYYINPLGGDIWFQAQYGTNLVLLLGIYLGWGSIWNLGLVISILEGKFGTKAFGSSGYLCLRNVQNGMVLTLVFSLFEMGFFWVPSLLCFGGYKTWVVIVAQSGLFCFGNSIKWVGFVVYFDTCIKRLFVKKVDLQEQA